MLQWRIAPHGAPCHRAEVRESDQSRRSKFASAAVLLRQECSENRRAPSTAAMPPILHWDGGGRGTYVLKRTISRLNPPQIDDNNLNDEQPDHQAQHTPDPVRLKQSDH